MHSTVVFVYHFKMKRNYLLLYHFNFSVHCKKGWICCERQNDIIVSVSQSQLAGLDKSQRPLRSSTTSRATSRSSKRRQSVSSQRSQSSNRRRSLTTGPSRQGGRKISTGSRATSHYRADKLTPYEEEQSNDEVNSK